MCISIITNNKTMEVSDRIKEIEKEMEEVDNLIEEKDKKWDYSRPYDEYSEYLRPERKRYSQLFRELRQIQPYTLSELSDYGDIMSLDSFIENVNYGGFIDYDGFGIYVKDNMETGIEIYPSDVKFNAIRREFDTIIWFNR